MIMSQTLKSVRATVSSKGVVTLVEPILLRSSTVAMVTIVVDDEDIDEEPLTQEEIEAMKEAEKDRKEGNWDAFISMDEMKKRLNIA